MSFSGNLQWQLSATSSAKSEIDFRKWTPRMDSSLHSPQMISATPSIFFNQASKSLMMWSHHHNDSNTCLVILIDICVWFSTFAYKPWTPALWFHLLHLYVHPDHHCHHHCHHHHHHHHHRHRHDCPDNHLHSWCFNLLTPPFICTITITITITLTTISTPEALFHSLHLYLHHHHLHHLLAIHYTTPYVNPSSLLLAIIELVQINSNWLATMLDQFVSSSISRWCKHDGVCALFALNLLLYSSFSSSSSSSSSSCSSSASADLIQTFEDQPQLTCG